MGTLSFSSTGNGTTLNFGGADIALLEMETISPVGGSGSFQVDYELTEFISLSTGAKIGEPEIVSDSYLDMVSIAPFNGFGNFVLGDTMPTVSFRDSSFLLKSVPASLNTPCDPITTDLLEIDPLDNELRGYTLSTKAASLVSLDNSIASVTVVVGSLSELIPITIVSATLTEAVLGSVVTITNDDISGSKILIEYQQGSIGFSKIVPVTVELLSSEGTTYTDQILAHFVAMESPTGKLTASDASLDFGQILNGGSGTASLTLTNNNLYTPITISSVGYIVTLSAPVFEVTTQGYPWVIQPGESLTLDLEFTPTGTHLFGCILSVGYATDSEFTEVTLLGTGVDGQGAFTNTEIDTLSAFTSEIGTIPVVANVPRPITQSVVNINAAPFIVTSITADHPEYSITQPASLIFRVIKSGSSLVVPLVYLPLADGFWENTNLTIDGFYI